jgi:tetratricopeptide (TPR) repeat protein
MARIIHSYDAGASLPDDDKERENFYRSFLNKKRALILLDNALDDRQVQPLLPPPESSVIVTSRQELSLPTITVCLFEPDKSIELLKAILAEKRAIKQEYESSLVEIARLCGNLPLALRLAGAFLAKSRDMSPEDYAGSLRDERSRLERIDKGSAENGVQASLNLSYSQLHAKAAAAFRMLSVFPADFDSGAEEVICQDEGHEQLRELLQWSLAEYQEETKRYRLHDLVRIYAKDQLEKNGEADIGEAHQLHSAYYLPVLKRSNELLLSGGTSLVSGLKLFDLEWQNISAGQSWARIHSSASQECSEICSNYALQGSILDLRLHQRENIQWREAALDCARRTGNKKAEGAHLSNLGSAYFLLSDARKAIEYHEQALAIAREIGDRRGEGADLGNLGNAYAALGDARKAIEYYEQALVIAREIRDRRNEGAWLGNLGNAYGDLGDARKAIEYYEQALVIAREIGDRRNEGNSLGNLGNAYGDLGDVRKAIEYYEKRLAIAREIGDRRGEGNVFGNLGIAYNNLGDTRKAIVYYEQALAIAREIGDRRREGAGLGNLGSAYIDLGDTRKAIEYYEQALAIDREIGDKRGEGANLGNLGIAYKNLGDARKAIEYHEQALAIDREIGDKRGEGADLGNLGSVFYGLDDIDKSQDHYQQQLMIAREIGDRNGEANALWGQAICLKKKNDPEQAIEKAESALMIFEQIESPSVSTMRKLLAEWKK